MRGRSVDGNEARANEAQANEAQANETEELVNGAMGAFPCPLLVIGAEGTVERANEAWLELARADGEFLPRVRSAALARLEGEGEVADVPSAGRWYRVTAARSDGSVWISLADVSDYHRRLRAARTLAEADPLTGLLNRRALATQADRVGSGPLTALAMIDLDGFKRVNDRYGHACGDAVLTLVSRRLAETLRAGDVIARWGGDEFVVLLDCASEDEVQGIHARLLRSLRQPYRVPGVPDPLRVGATVGMSLAPSAEFDLARALQRADAEMYRRKRPARRRPSAAADVGWMGVEAG